MQEGVAVRRMSIVDLRDSKRENLRLYVEEFQQRRSIVRNMPVHIQIEMTNTCNLRCIMCSSVWSEDAHGEHHYIDSSILQKLYPYYRYAVLIEPQGNGEPMLHKDFMSNLEEIKKNSAFVIFTTNGTLLTPEKIRKIVDLRVDTIVFSIDGATKKTYDAIRKGTTFENVIGKIRLLDQTKKEVGRADPHDRPEWMVNFVVMQQNYREMPKMLDILHAYGGTFVNFLGLGVYSEEMEKWYKQYQPEDKALIDDVNALAREYGIGVFYHPLFYSPSVEKPVINAQESNWLCYRPWKSVFVAWDGATVPCCFWNKNISNWGNLTRQSMEEIWNGEKAQITRSTLRERKYPEECTYCREHKSFWNVPDDAQLLFSKCF